MCVDAREVDVPAVELGRRHRPESTHRFEVLVGAGGALVQRNAERGELGGEVAHADAHEPPTRDLIDARQLLGQQHRLVQRQLQDAGADRDRRGVGGRQRERDDGVEERDLGRDRVVRWLGTGEHDVLTGPERIQSAGLGVLGDPHERSRIGAGPVVDGVQPELHPSHRIAR